MRPIHRRLTAGTAVAALAVVGFASPALASHEDLTGPSGTAGDEFIVVPINDSTAGGTYFQEFQRVYDGATPEGTPVYVYVPVGAIGNTNPVGVHSLDPAFDHNPADDFTPCADAQASDFAITQDQVNYLGDKLADQIVAVDEDHFGQMGPADPTDPSTEALVTLVYNVQDDAYYDCSVTSYTAGYFAPEYIDESGMNVIVLDALDWANRVGSDPSTAPWGDGDASNDRPELYEGVIAHELEHLLMNYSDPGELSWVDEGLADTAAFLNGFDMTGSHLTYQQVFHRETSLTRWGGGLENYGASFSFFSYLWEQAGGNGGGDLTPNLKNDHVAGDQLIQLIFQEQADGMEGVQNAIDTYNANNGTAADLRDADILFQDWVVTMYLDDEDSSLFDLENFDLGAASGGWTIDIANDEFWDDRGNYRGRLPEAKWDRRNNRPAGTALPFGASYEKFKNAGRYVSIDFAGDDTTQVAPHEGDTHWWGGYASQSNTELNVTSPITGGETVNFWNWHFIEEGWDYGFVEAQVNGEWVTVPVQDASGATVSSNDDPHGNNEEGNGITGTSGGAYFVDEPTYQQYSVTVPDGATGLRFRYSTDAAYLDTGWFIDEVTVDGAAATLASDEWVETDGVQDNNWAVQVISNCDLTPGTLSAGEINDGAGNFVYRYTGEAAFSTSTLNTRCANGNQADFVVAVSNLPTGDLAVLDAPYDYRVVTQKK
jgi:hypothetical protein